MVELPPLPALFKKSLLMGFDHKQGRSILVTYEDEGLDPWKAGHVAIRNTILLYSLV